jgi:hypothetical protein
MEFVGLRVLSRFLGPDDHFAESIPDVIGLLSSVADLRDFVQVENRFGVV